MTYPVETDTIPIPSHHECTLFNSEDPDNGIFYDSSHAVCLAYYNDGEYLKAFLVRGLQGTFVEQQESWVGVVKDMPRITAQILTKHEAANRYCRWTPTVRPLETGLFTAMKEA